MKDGKYILLPIACIMFLITGVSSCVSKVFTTKSQKAFFSNSPGNIKDYIETDGYYRCDSDFYSWFMTNNLLIYEDNSFAFFLWNDVDSPRFNGNWHTHLERQIAYEDSLCSIQNIDILNNFDVKSFLHGYDINNFKLDGGAYTIEDNKLILEQPVVLDLWKRFICRNIFKIIDRRTLRRETFQLVGDDSIIQFDTVATFHFVPAHNIPSSLVVNEKKYSWMWKSVEEWKQFKALRKEYYESQNLLEKQK